MRLAIYKFMIRGKINDENSKYNGREFIAESEDSVIILVAKGQFFNGAPMFQKFDRRIDEFIND